MINKYKIVFIYFKFVILLVCMVAVPRNVNGGAKVKAVQDANPDIIRGIDLLYDWEFDRAEELFSNMCARNPTDPAPFFYYAMVTWSRLASGFWTPQYIREYAERIDKTIFIANKKIEAENADSFTYFYLGGALGFRGRFALMERKWFTAFNLAYDAVQALKTCQRMDPGNKDVLLGLGIYDYYTDRLSSTLKLISFLLIRKGGKEEGLQKLHVAAKGALYSGTEAKSMLVHIYLFLESGYEAARPLAEDLANRFKNNPRYRFLQGITYIQLGMENEYGKVVDALLERSRTDASGSKAAIWKNQALYLQASYCLFRNQYDKARSLLDTIRYHADPLTDPAMIAWPLIKTGMSYDLEGYRDKALVYYKRILEMGNGAGAQFLAEKYIDAPPEKGDPFIGY